MKKKGKGKRPKKAGFFYYMKPKNLSAEIGKYGYTYTTGRTLGVYLALAAAACLLGAAFRLRFAACACIVLAGAVILPSVIYGSYKKLYEQKRFSDLVLYMEQMLYSFKRSPRVISALYDTLEVFEEETDPMRQKIVRAVHVIETRADSAEGLSEIEKGYGNDRLLQLHRILVKIERLGGDYGSSVTLLLEGNKQWADRVSLQQKETAKQRRNLLIVMALNVIICGFMLFALPKDYSITGYPLYQAAAALFFSALLFIYAKIDQKMSLSWLGDDGGRPWQDTVEMYEKVKRYDPVKERKKSICYAAAPAALLLMMAAKAAAAGTFGAAEIILLIVLSVLLYICLNQHSIGQRLYKKTVTRELEKKFSTWLMEVALRSQLDNIQVAIMGSYENCSEVLKPALQELISDLEQNPVGIGPYTRFLKEFDVPEIHSAMKMFYAISEGNGGAVDEQVTELISRNNKLLDKAEQIRNEEQLTSFQTLQYAVMMAGAGKLLADMALFVLVFLNGSYL